RVYVPETGSGSKSEVQAPVVIAPLLTIDEIHVQDITGRRWFVYPQRRWGVRRVRRRNFVKNAVRSCDFGHEWHSPKTQAMTVRRVGWAGQWWAFWK
ncbi:hypothetical protein, partial [Amycolatopsis lurida]|uniref:hypothetical protein n=1 Tax=Amycolatopsis lurida TaxID=31959 RepID=UPI00365C0853